MDRMDTMLGLLRDEELPAGIATLNAAVMDGLSARQERDFSRRALTLAAVVAATTGLLLGANSGAPAAAEPLLAIPSSAPSHLLNG